MKDELHVDESVSSEQLTRWRALQARKAELEREIAANAPHRPRPWHDIARPNQLPPPGTWTTWLILSGRAWGKTRVGAEWLAEKVARNPGTEWAIIAPTWRDCKRTCLEGRSGLLKAFLPGEVESINISELTIRLTNGSKVYGYSADGYERLRGTNLSGAWVDEAASMADLDDMFAYALRPALRIGDYPQVLITTTPRPIKFLKKLLAREDGSVVVTRGSIWDNAANLSKSALAELRAEFEGTRAGRQELEGEMLDDLDGALWNHDLLEDTRVKRLVDVPSLSRIVVGVDPAVTSGENSDKTGIIVAGRSHEGHLYVLEDLTMRGTPHACMTKAVSAYHRWKADRIIGEVNNGGDYIEGVLRTVDENAAYKTVRATRGKVVRAEPVAALWEQGRGHMVGMLPDLEDQMCSFTTDLTDKKKKNSSDDRVDALVWAATELNVGSSAMIYLSQISRMCSKCDMPNKKASMLCRGCGTPLTNTA